MQNAERYNYETPYLLYIYTSNHANKDVHPKAKVKAEDQFKSAISICNSKLSKVKSQVHLHMIENENIKTKKQSVQN